VTMRQDCRSLTNFQIRPRQATARHRAAEPKHLCKRALGPRDRLSVIGERSIVVTLYAGYTPVIQRSCSRKKCRESSRSRRVAGSPWRSWTGRGRGGNSAGLSGPASRPSSPTRLSLVSPPTFSQKTLRSSRSLLLQLVSALAFLHAPAQGIAYCDVKQANIRLAPSGCAKLANFAIGVAYDLLALDEKHRTRSLYHQ
jgi:hypothetical protein